MQHYHMRSVIVVIFLAACGSKVPEALLSHTATPLQQNTASPTLTLGEQAIISDIEALYSQSTNPKFYSKRSDCIQAINDRTIKHCVFITNIEHVMKPEWKQLLPDTIFYLVDISGWRSSESLLPNETQDSGITRYLAAWQNGQTYYAEDFDHLLEDNAVIISDINRELVAQSFALMSIPNHLRGEVRFLGWKAIEPRVYRFNYSISHILKAWTEIWGCEVFWSFGFDNEQITVVSIQSNSCYNKNYGGYIEDMSFVDIGDEGVLTNIAPHSQEFYPKSHSGVQ